MIEPAAPTPPVFPWEAEPLKLWSLWDMLTFDGYNLVSAVQLLSQNKALLAKSPNDGGGVRAVMDDIQVMVDVIDGLPLSRSLKAQARRLLMWVPVSPVQTFVTLVSEFEACLQVELQDHLFLCIPSSDRQLFEDPDTWFGAEALAMLPVEAQEAARSACQCLALGQGTAAVFESMAVLEHGLRRMAKRLKVTYPKARPIEVENWKNIIDKIEAALKAREGRTKTPKLRAVIEADAKAAAHFRSFKDAWRNTVSHAKVRYDIDEARMVLEHVRGFMSELAKA